MAKLYLVRHSQASFGHVNYDQLSELGHKQSPYIVNHFGTAEKPGIDALYSGDMLRQRQTAEGSFPGMTSTTLPGLNEFNHENVLQIHRPEIADRDKAIALVMGQKDPKKFVEDEFDIAMDKWMLEEGDRVYQESFKHFSERCLVALQHIITISRKENHKEVVAVTSGGVISFLVAHLLNLPQPKLAGLNTSIANASVTCLLFNDHKTSLRYFNNYSHIPKDMVTFF